MGTYKCVECEEEFEAKPACVIHHLDTKHQEFQINGSDVKVIVKS